MILRLDTSNVLTSISACPMCDGASKIDQHPCGMCHDGMWRTDFDLRPILANLAIVGALTAAARR